MAGPISRTSQRKHARPGAPSRPVWCRNSLQRCASCAQAHPRPRPPQGISDIDVCSIDWMAPVNWRAIAGDDKGEYTTGYKGDHDQHNGGNFTGAFMPLWAGYLLVCGFGILFSIITSIMVKLEQAPPAARPPPVRRPSAALPESSLLDAERSLGGTNHRFTAPLPCRRTAASSSPPRTSTRPAATSRRV